MQWAFWGSKWFGNAERFSVRGVGWIGTGVNFNCLQFFDWLRLFIGQRYRSSIEGETKHSRALCNSEVNSEDVSVLSITKLWGDDFLIITIMLSVRVEFTPVHNYLPRLQITDHASMIDLASIPSSAWMVMVSWHLAGLGRVRARLCGTSWCEGIIWYHWYLWISKKITWQQRGRMTNDDAYIQVQVTELLLRDDKHPCYVQELSLTKQ